MKKAIFLLFITLLSSPIFAQRARTLLKIRDLEGRNITIEINGRRYEKVDKIINVKDLPPGRHDLRIYTISQNRSGARTASLIYNGRIKTRPSYIYYITVDDFEGLDIIEDCCLGDNGPWTEGDVWYRNRSYDKQDWHRDNDIYHPDRDGQNTRNNNPSGRNNNRNNRDDWNQYSQIMSVARYNTLIQQIKGASFESEKVTIVKQAVDANNITCDQLLGIIKEMSFESSRLELAKYAYPQLSDPQNIFTINSGFWYSSSKDEFAKFLQGQPRR